tara:strand:- start:1631 stop:3922 length:2292 start_codon:yes stop_codon:yes gene_type:complete
MTVNLEIKGTLAKLLATEDLIIENKNVETACFNVQTRVLTLPMWEKADEVVYDMLVGHEVGHALFTPNRDIKVKVPKQFVNVTEDARIEKLMKRKYLGLGRTFYNAYQQLFEDDFFELENENIKTLNLADRINLHYKVGPFLAIWFSEEEQKIVDLIGDSETFEDAEHAAEVLYAYCKDHMEEDNDGDETESERYSLESFEGLEGAGEPQDEKSEDEADQEEEGEGRPNLGSDNTEYDDLNKSDEELLKQLLQSSAGEEPQNNKDEETASAGQNASLHNTEGEPQVQTDDMLKQKIQDLITNDSQPNEYIELPDLNLDSVINSNDQVYSYIKKEWAAWEEAVERELKAGNDIEGRNSYFENHHLTFEKCDADYRQTKKESQKAVNYLVKEFEMKKAASSYARAATSKTGQLDTSKLHTYKFNEDLFKKVTTLQEGQSHGLVFVLDWSGSMSNVLKNTLRQLYNLIWFCKKVNIPFKVYAFTYEYNTPEYNAGLQLNDTPDHFTPKDGLLAIENRFSLMEFFNSDIRPKELDEQMKIIWRVARGLKDYATYPIPRKMSLSGTPLNESICALNQILPECRKEWGMEKIQCVILTDGDAHHLPRHKTVERPWETKPYCGTCGINAGRDYLRNRKTGRTYKIPHRYHEFTQLLIRYVNDVHPYVSFVGIRVLPNRDARYFINRYCGFDGEDFDKAKLQWKKYKSCSLPVLGYKKYIGMSDGSLHADDTEYVVPEQATKSQLKSYFNRSIKDKQLNKKVLSEFVELIA